MLRELISTVPTTQKHVVDWLQTVRIEGNGRLKGSKKRSTIVRLFEFRGRFETGGNENRILSPDIPFWFEHGLFTRSDSISKNSARTLVEAYYRPSTKAILLFT